MAADQRRKRLYHTNIVGCSSKVEHRTSKRKLVSTQSDLNTKSHISLDWDGNQKKVIAKREQVSISWRDLNTFISATPHCQKSLADVFSVPSETFELENLTDVLSYEAWQTCLSEDERNFLTQFLPRGRNAQQVVQPLLRGDNFHFGNPSLKWGESVCAGNAHPDMVVRQEQCIKADKRAYFSELQMYHNDLIGHLQKLKGRWESCKDPREEIVQMIWSRSKPDKKNKIQSCGDESKLPYLEQDITAPSESYSWTADEKAYSSDNHNSSVIKHGQLQKRTPDTEFIKDKLRDSSTTSYDVLNLEEPCKVRSIRRRNIHREDGAKYMSYFKISKKQHQLVTKHSGKSIQSRSLNRVLGNVDSLGVQPYQLFVEEEKKKLHEYWLQLATRDLPSAYANRRELQLKKLEMTKSLGNDLKDKFKDGREEEPESMLQNPNNVNLFLGIQENQNESFGTVDLDQKDNISSTSHESDTEDDADFISESLPGPETVLGEQDNVGSYFGIEDREKVNHESRVMEQKDNMPADHESDMDTDENSLAGLLHNQSLLQQPSPSGDHEFKINGTDSADDHCLAKSDVASPNMSDQSRKLNAADNVITKGVSLSSGGAVWQDTRTPNSYYDSRVTRGYSSINGLTLSNPQVNEEQIRFTAPSADLYEKNTTESLLHRQSDDGSFNFSNQERTELLQSLFQGERVVSYNSEQIRPRLDFQPLNNMLMREGQFPGHFQEQQLQPSFPLDPVHKKQNEVYMPQNISDNFYSDGGRYLITGQERFPLGSVPNWNTSSVRMAAPLLQPQFNSGELLNQNWFSNEHQFRSGLTGSGGVSVPREGIGSARNGDQSLFSVLSHCNQLTSSGPFDTAGSSVEQQQLITPKNFRMVGGSTSGINNGGQVTHSLDYLAGCDPNTTPLVPDDMAWMNYPHPNSALHDPTEKPYLRSWNH